MEVSPGRWFADCRIRDADGVTRRARRYTPEGVRDTKGAAAERALVDHLVQRTHSSGDEISGDTTITALWDAYRADLVERGRAPRTLQRYDEVSVFIGDGVGGVRLRELTTQRVEALLRTVEKTRGSGNAATTRSVLSGMCSMAVRIGAMESNIVRETLPAASTSKGPGRSLTSLELAQMLVDLRESTRPCPPVAGESKYRVPTVAEYAGAADLVDVFTMFAATGARISEVLGLQVSGIDWKARTVRIDGKVVRHPGVGLVRVSSADDPKNRDRVLPLPRFAVTMLRARLLAQPANEAGVIFPSSVGTLREPTGVNKQWRRVRSALELDWVTGHTFRRTVATVIDDEKMGARVAADQLGHSTVSMTLNKYMSRGSVRPEVAALLDRIVAGDGDSKVESFR